jgi:LysR family transcriptional regulator, nod-box dependent transcriptional activator
MTMSTRCLLSAWVLIDRVVNNFHRVAEDWKTSVRINNLDLNLLIALDILLEEQNITRAAERLHMTQSATSGVLSRLRKYFEDDLLVRVGRSMQPTPYANEIAAPVREVLKTIRAFTAKDSFTPASSRRHFKIMASDSLIHVFLARLVGNIYAVSPHITFEFLALNDSPSVVRSADLIFAPEQYVLDGYSSRFLFEEEHVCIVWKHNSLVEERLSLEQYLAMGHVSTGFGRNRAPSIEEQFISELGFNRRIEVVASDFNSVPSLVIGTQRVATVHSRIAYAYAQYLPLKILHLPIKIPVIREFMLWHSSKDFDPSHRWMREQIFRLNAEESPTIS